MPAPFVENAVVFPLDGFSSLVKDQVTIGVWVHLWVFNSVPLIYLPVTVPIISGDGKISHVYGLAGLIY